MFVIESLKVGYISHLTQSLFQPYILPILPVFLSKPFTRILQVVGGISRSLSTPFASVTVDQGNSLHI